MSPATVGAILDAIARTVAVEAGAEITLEANPSSVEAARFRGYRAPASTACRSACSRSTTPICARSAACTRSSEALAAIDVARATFERCLLRPDLRAARARRSQAWRAELGEAPGARGPAPLALPAHHRAGHAVRRAARARQAARARRASRRTPSTTLTQELTRAARPAGLRDLQPRRARRGVPPQPALLALRRVCGHRPRRPRPRRRSAARAAPPRPSGSPSAGLRCVEARGPRHRGEHGAEPEPSRPTRRC